MCKLNVSVLFISKTFKDEQLKKREKVSASLFSIKHILMASPHHVSQRQGSCELQCGMIRSLQHMNNRVWGLRLANGQREKETKKVRKTRGSL